MKYISKPILKSILIVSLISVLTVHLQGCAVAALVAATKYGNAKKEEARQGCQKNYNDYLKVAKNPMTMAQYCGDQK